MTLRSLSAFPIALFLTACGGDGGGGGGGGDPVLEVVKWTPSGDNQTDTVGQTLPNVIRVKVTLDGALASGITVNFFGGTLGTPSMVTGSNGIATSSWTLAEVAGPQQVIATVDGAVGSPITFHATAVPDSPYLLNFGSASSGFVADTGMFFDGMVVKVADSFSNGIQGRWVQWSSTGPLTLSTDSIISGVTGLVTMVATAGTTAGDITVTATVDGLIGSPRTFTGSVVPAPTTVTVASNFYSPANLTISAGSAVQWVWGTGTHSVTSTGDPAFAGNDVASAPFTLGPILFTTPGVYTYHCSVHSEMQGSITVN